MESCVKKGAMASSNFPASSNDTSCGKLADPPTFDPATRSDFAMPGCASPPCFPPADRPGGALDQRAVERLLFACFPPMVGSSRKTIPTRRVRTQTAASPGHSLETGPFRLELETSAVFPRSAGATQASAALMNRRTDDVTRKAEPAEPIAPEHR